MNALTVLCVAGLVACTSAHLVGHPGFYSYPGLLGSYPSFYPYPAFRSVAPAPVTFKTVAPAPVPFKTVVPGPLTYNVAPFAPFAPVAPVASVAPVAPIASAVSSQFHAQDELGQYSFGYSGDSSSRSESRDAFGVVRGAYNYVDSEGNVQTQQYVADALGFRVAGTNLPVAPDASETVAETAEVAQQRAALAAAHAEAAAAAMGARKKRSVVAAAPGVYSPLRFSYGFSNPHPYSYPTFTNTPYHFGFPAFQPYAAPLAAAPGVLTYSGVPAAPTTYAAAAPAVARDATLLKVVHNPGHATSYRVL